MVLTSCYQLSNWGAPSEVTEFPAWAHTPKAHKANTSRGCHGCHCGWRIHMSMGYPKSSKLWVLALIKGPQWFDGLWGTVFGCFAFECLNWFWSATSYSYMSHNSGWANPAMWVWNTLLMNMGWPTSTNSSSSLKHKTSTHLPVGCCSSFRTLRLQRSIAA